MNFHSRLQALVTDGVFTPSGGFVACPKIDLNASGPVFRHRVLRMLLRERRIDETVIYKLLGWRHSGCSLHDAVRTGAADTEGRRAVAASSLGHLTLRPAPAHSAPAKYPLPYSLQRVALAA